MFETVFLCFIIVLLKNKAYYLSQEREWTTFRTSEGAVIVPSELDQKCFVKPKMHQIYTTLFRSPNRLGIDIHIFISHSIRRLIFFSFGKLFRHFWVRIPSSGIGAMQHLTKLYVRGGWVDVQMGGGKHWRSSVGSLRSVSKGDRWPCYSLYSFCCSNDLQVYPRSIIFMSFKSQYATSYFA